MSQQENFEELIVRPTVDMLILANKAEVRDNLLYIEGGGVDNLPLNSFDRPVGLHVAGNILVPWSTLSQRHVIDVVAVDEDGRQLRDPATLTIAPLTAPPQATPGQSARQAFAFVFVCPIPGPGTYAVVARSQGVELRRAVFQVRRADGGSPGVT